MNVVTIVGSRTYPHKNQVVNTITNLGTLLKDNIQFISGGQAEGVDGWVKKTIIKRNLAYIEGTPDHYSRNKYSFDICPITNQPIEYRQLYNPYFYHLRNERMVVHTLKNHGLALIFRHKNSRGTRSFLKYCTQYGLSHIVYDLNSKNNHKGHLYTCYYLKHNRREAQHDTFEINL